MKTTIELLDEARETLRIVDAELGRATEWSQAPHLWQAVKNLRDVIEPLLDAVERMAVKLENER